MFNSSFYHVNVFFSPDLDSTVDLQYTLVSDKLTIARSDGVRQPVIKGQKLYNMVFSGVNLLEEEVKAWLSSCAETVSVCLCLYVCVCVCVLCLKVIT